MSCDAMQTFSVGAKEGAARAGTLLTRQGVLRTPTALVYTRRGGSMFLTPDMLEKLRPQAQGVQINAMQLCARRPGGAAARGARVWGGAGREGRA
jgi:queuine/archaeosine tRNA-ribosyltransferase